MYKIMKKCIKLQFIGTHLKLISVGHMGKRFLSTQNSVTHRLSVPASARKVSYRINGPLVVICQGVCGRRNEQTNCRNLVTTYKPQRAPNEDSNQPAHPLRLISLR